MLSIERIEAILLDNINSIKKYGVSKLGIFGSYSKGCATEESDIDILVAFEPDKKSFDNYIDLKFFLEEIFSRKIDLVIEEAVKKELREAILGSVRYVKAA